MITKRQFLRRCNSESNSPVFETNGKKNSPSEKKYEVLLGFYFCRTGSLSVVHVLRFSCQYRCWWPACHGAWRLEDGSKDIASWRQHRPGLATRFLRCLVTPTTTITSRALLAMSTAQSRLHVMVSGRVGASRRGGGIWTPQIDAAWTLRV